MGKEKTVTGKFSFNIEDLIAMVDEENEEEDSGSDSDDSGNAGSDNDNSNGSSSDSDDNGGSSGPDSGNGSGSDSGNDNGENQNGSGGTSVIQKPLSDSILLSVKKQLGIAPDYGHFDPDIIFHINTVFSILHQLGAGPEDGFLIQGAEEVWRDYIGDKPKRLNLIKSYVYLKVRLLFDPPTNASVAEATNRMVDELEWRINAAADFRKE